MSDEKEPASDSALAPAREQIVDFYGDSIPAAQLADGAIMVPIRPICEHLGLDWSSQRQRINRDPVLRDSQGVVIITTPGGEQGVLCLPLKLLPGWLFGLNASRVKEELREKIQRYQRDAYEVLWNAFKADILPTAPAPHDLTGAALAVENARALLHLAEQQLEFERRLSTMTDYMRPFVTNTRAALQDYGKRLTGIELQLSAGALIDETQVTEIQLAVKALAAVLQAQGQLNGHQRVYAELYRRYGIGSYRKLPAARYQEVLDWLHDWFDELNAE